ncbi:hypothetical protein A2U01_0098159, partial [Trifolium medium]|nr:hypothetical protein [Trifolium medium]
MKGYAVRTQKVCKVQIEEWVERMTMEINSRGPKAKDSELEKERLWNSKVFDLGNSVNRLRSTMELA